MLHAGGIRAVTQGAKPVDPVEAAESFKQAFVKDYGQGGPQWLTTGWQEATARAHGQYKFLFVYLHSHYHQVLLLSLSICSLSLSLMQPYQACTCKMLLFWRPRKMTVRV